MPTSIEALKKAFLIGVGASVVTAEKIGDFIHGVVDEMVDRGEITARDARKLTDDLKTRAGKETVSLQKNMQKNMESAVHSAVKSLGLVTQDDLKQLRRELGLKPATVLSAKTRKTAARSSNGKSVRPAKKTSGSKKR